MNDEFTQAVIAYQKTGNNWSEIRDRISLYAYQYPSKRMNWDSDRCSDFFLCFSPRIPGLIKRYQPHYPFETYLCNTLRWTMKSFMADLVAQEHYDVWCEKENSHSVESLREISPEQVGDFMPEENEYSSDSPLQFDSNGCLKNVFLRRHVLFMVLRYTAEIDSSLVPKIATIIGVSEEWLDEILCKTRQAIAKKIELREALRERRNEYWYKKQKACHRMHINGKWDPYLYQQWKEKTQYWEKRFQKINEKIRKMKVVVGHRIIAEILNTSISVVTSSLYYLRRNYPEVLDLGEAPQLKSLCEHSSCDGKPPQKGRDRAYIDATRNQYT